LRSRASSFGGYGVPASKQATRPDRDHQHDAGNNKQDDPGVRGRQAFAAVESRRTRQSDQGKQGERKRNPSTARGEQPGHLPPHSPLIVSHLPLWIVQAVVREGKLSVDKNHPQRPCGAFKTSFACRHGPEMSQTTFLLILLSVLN
jgi:hypothetical protein